MDQTTNSRPQTKIMESQSLRKIVFFGVILLVMLLGLGFVVSGELAEGLNLTSGQPDSGEQASVAKGVVGADSDLTTFLAMVELATDKARQVTSDVTLRQAIVDQETATFFFTDAAATQEFLVKVPFGDELARLDNLTVEMNDPAVAHYIDRPARGLNFDNLRIGPERVKETIMEQATGCDFSHLVLYPEGNTLIWLAFCATDEGLVSGRMNSRTGDFDLEPLATWPTVATPIP